MAKAVAMTPTTETTPRETTQQETTQQEKAPSKNVQNKAGLADKFGPMRKGLVGPVTVVLQTRKTLPAPPQEVEMPVGRVQKVIEGRKESLQGIPLKGRPLKGGAQKGTPPIETLPVEITPDGRNLKKDARRHRLRPVGVSRPLTVGICPGHPQRSSGDRPTRQGAAKVALMNQNARAMRKRDEVPLTRVIPLLPLLVVEDSTGRIHPT